MFHPRVHRDGVARLQRRTRVRNSEARVGQSEFHISEGMATEFPGVKGYRARSEHRRFERWSGEHSVVESGESVSPIYDLSFHLESRRKLRERNLSEIT